MVNIVDVTMLDLVRTQHRGFCDKFFEVFTPDKPVISARSMFDLDYYFFYSYCAVNWHGYPSAIRQLLFSRAFETQREILVVLA